MTFAGNAAFCTVGTEVGKGGRGAPGVVAGPHIMANVINGTTFGSQKIPKKAQDPPLGFVHTPRLAMLFRRSWDSIRI